MKSVKKTSQYLIRDNQPKPYYDYDGLTGVWLWIPWWIYAILTILVWPFSIYILPHLHIHYSFIKINFNEYQQEATSILLAFTVLSMILSAFKKWKIQRKLNVPAEQEFLKNISNPVKQNLNKSSHNIQGRNKQNLTKSTTATLEKETISPQLGLLNIHASETGTIIEKPKRSRKTKAHNQLENNDSVHSNLIKDSKLHTDDIVVKKIRKPRTKKIKQADENFSIADIPTKKPVKKKAKKDTSQLDLDIS